jgi:hypothetical protein
MWEGRVGRDWRVEQNLLLPARPAGISRSIPYPRAGEVREVGNLSAHADHVEILDWLDHFGRPPRRAFVTHDEALAADAMRQHI